MELHRFLPFFSSISNITPHSHISGTGLLFFKVNFLRGVQALMLLITPLGSASLRVQRNPVSIIHHRRLLWLMNSNCNIHHQNTWKMAVIGVPFTIRKSEELLISISFIPLFIHRELILPSFILFTSILLPYFQCSLLRLFFCGWPVFGNRV